MPTISWTINGNFREHPIVSEANNSDHWRKKHKRQKVVSNYVKLAFRKELSEVKLPCKVILTRVSSRQLDYDNLVIAFKKVRDTVADLLIPGKAPGQADSSPLIEWEYRQVRGQVGEKGFTINVVPLDKIGMINLAVHSRLEELKNEENNTNESK